MSDGRNPVILLLEYKVQNEIGPRVALLSLDTLGTLFAAIMIDGAFRVAFIAMAFIFLLIAAIELKEGLQRQNRRIELANDRIVFHSTADQPDIDRPLSDIKKLTFVTIFGDQTSYTIVFDEETNIQFDDQTDRHNDLKSRLEILTGKTFVDLMPKKRKPILQD